MKDYANQDWRSTDTEIERENGFAAICFTAFVSVIFGAVAYGYLFT